MKKHYCFTNLIFTAICTLTGCNKSIQTSENALNNISQSETITDSNLTIIDENLYDDFILEINGETPNENSPKDVVFYCLWKLKHIRTFKKESTNIVTSKVLLANYKQTTKESLIKNKDKYYNYINTSSTFVNLIHQVFYYNGNVIYQNDSKDYIVEPSTKYDNTYGFSPNKLLSGQVFNDSSIIQCSFEEEFADKYTLKLILDKKYANALIQKRMKEFGSLNNYPEFIENTIFYLTIDKNYLPLSYSYAAKYKVDMPILGKITCIENNNATYSSFNENVNIEQENFYLSKINNI